MKNRFWFAPTLGVLIVCLKATAAHSENIPPNAPSQDYFLRDADTFLYLRKTDRTLAGVLVGGLSHGGVIGICLEGKAFNSKIVDVITMTPGDPPQKLEPISLSGYKRYRGKIEPSYTEYLETCVREFRNLKRQR